MRLLHRRSARLLLFTVAIVALAKAAAALPGYSIDDYWLRLIDAPSTMMLGQGRLGQALFGQLAYALGIEPQHASPFFVVLGILTWSVFATALVQHWSLARYRTLAVAVAAIVATHPYTTEIFTFRTALGSSMVALGLFAALLLPRRWTPRSLIAGIVVFAFAMSIYQVVLHFAVMVSIVGAALWLSRWRPAIAVPGRSVRPRRSPWRILRQRQWGLFVVTIGGTVSYAVLTTATLRVAGVVEAQRTALLSIADISRRVHDVGWALRYRLLSSDPMVPLLVKWLLLALLAVALVQLTVHARRLPFTRALLTNVAVWILLAAGLVWMLGLTLVLAQFWPAPRVLSHVGILWGGVLAMAYCGSAPWLRRLLLVIVVPIVLSFVGMNQKIFADQYRLNRRDADTASRIVGRLEQLPGFTETLRVAVVGQLDRTQLALRSQDMDMNTSAFVAGWAKVPLLAEVSGYQFTAASDLASQAIAAAYCRRVDPWPAPQSVALQSSLAIVCLSRVR